MDRISVCRVADDTHIDEHPWLKVKFSKFRIFPSPYKPLWCSLSPPLSIPTNINNWKVGWNLPMDAPGVTLDAQTSCSAHSGWQSWTELQNQPFHFSGAFNACSSLVRISPEPARDHWEVNGQAQIYLQPQTNALACPFAEFRGWFVFGF